MCYTLLTKGLLKGNDKVNSYPTIHDDCRLLSLIVYVLLDFSLTVKAAPHECVIRTSQF